MDDEQENDPYRNGVLLLDTSPPSGRLELPLRNFFVRRAGKQGDTPLSLCPALKPITLLVGPNNVGKSRLIRHLFRNNWIALDSVSAQRLENMFRWAKDVRAQLDSPHAPAHERQHLLPLVQQLENLEKSGNTPLATFSNAGTTGLSINSKTIELRLGPPSPEQEPSNERLHELLKCCGLSGADILPGKERVDGPRCDRYVPLLRIVAQGKARARYVPALRSTLRLIDGYVVPTGTSDAQRAEYSDPIGRAILLHHGIDRDAAGTPLDTSTKLVFTGQRLYEEVSAAGGGARELRHRWEEGTSKVIQELLGLNGAKLIASNDKTPDFGGNHSALQHLKVALPKDSAEDWDLLIHDLGDGFSACLTILLPVLLGRDKDDIVFIEEPEINLHPGLQRQLVKLLCDPLIRRNNQLVVSTHSPIILDAFAEYAGVNHVGKESDRESELGLWRIYNETGSDGQIRHILETVPSISLNILEDLGATTSALLARRLIWVEGPTDVNYVKGLIELFDPKLVEGRDFAVISYGGSLLDSFLTQEGRTSRSFTGVAYYSCVIADLDIGKGAKHKKRREQIQAACGTYLTTEPAVEMENIFSKEVWEMLFPQIKRTWKTTSCSIPSKKLLTVRMGTIARYLYDGQPLKSKGKTLDPADKAKASMAFLRFVR